MTRLTQHTVTLPAALVDRAKRYVATRGLDTIYQLPFSRLVEVALAVYLDQRDGENEQ